MKEIKNYFVLTVISFLFLALAPLGAQAWPLGVIPNLSGGTVTIVDDADGSTSTITDLYRPLGVSVSPDGLTAYVTKYDYSNGAVYVIDMVSATLTATIPTGRHTWNTVVSPDGSTVYASNMSSDSVSVIDTATNTVAATITGIIRAGGIALTPDGAKLYVGGSGRTYIIDTATHAVTSIATWPGYTLYGATMSPDGSRVYVRDYNSGIHVIDTATEDIVATISLPGYGHNVAISPDGSKLYVPVYSDGNVYIIDTATNAIINFFSTGISSPAGVSVTPDGAHLYIGHANNVGQVQVYDTSKLDLLDAFTVGGYPYAMGARMFSLTESPPPPPVVTCEDELETVQAELDAANAANDGLTAANGQLTADLTAANADNAALTSANAQLTTDLDTANAANAALTAANGLLTEDLAAANQTIADQAEQIAALEAKLESVASSADTAKSTLGGAFGDPGFDLPGDTPEEEIEALVSGIMKMNQGSKMQLYKALGGSPGKKK